MRMLAVFWLNTAVLTAHHHLDMDASPPKFYQGQEFMLFMFFDSLRLFLESIFHVIYMQCDLREFGRISI